MRCKRCHRLKSYPSVSLYYACDDSEADLLLKSCTDKGYTYIADNSTATCREFDRVVMMMDENFFYDEEGCLRCSKIGEYRVRRLFHGLNRAKSSLAIIVKNNPGLFDLLLTITQG